VIILDKELITENHKIKSSLPNVLYIYLNILTIIAFAPKGMVRPGTAGRDEGAAGTSA
jgi:hypothetical protein